MHSQNADNFKSSKFKKHNFKLSKEKNKSNEISLVKGL